MKTMERMHLPRRKFILSSSLFLSGAAVLKTTSLLAQTAPAAAPASSVRGSELPEELSAQELELVKRSSMSEDMQNFWHKGYSCAETGLMVALRFMQKPEDLVWAASGFAGGMMHQDLCGFLTSGIMAIGLHAGGMKMEKNAATMQQRQKVQQYWSWWVETAPLHCAEIRGGREPMDFKVCERLGRLAAAKIESLLKAG
ncbi:MAG: C_GCAxxG_C_C family protein [Acidobacteria bacterium]|nr:C_GCAxxG_C_C family protein [Acidobacteriota bacterium]